MDELVGKKAIITGGASGIGRAAALLFAGAGAAVVIAESMISAARLSLKKYMLVAGKEFTCTVMLLKPKIVKEQSKKQSIRSAEWIYYSTTPASSAGHP